MIEHEIKQIILKHFQIKQNNEITLKYHSSSLFPLYKVSCSKHIVYKQKTFFCLAIKQIHNQQMAISEWEGLQFLYHCNARVPFPVEIIHTHNNSFLIMEFIEKTKFTQNSKNDLLKSLKNLYMNKESFYGFTKDNFIGTLVQKNSQYKKFFDFWWYSRIEPVMDMAIEKQYFTLDEKNLLYKIKKNFCNEWNLEADEPRAIHGDLWSGNLLFSNDLAFLIDPSISYSHPLQDFAMLELFGSPLHFSDYQAIAMACKFKILPEMIEFFQIYPLLVHVILFGIPYKRNIIYFIQKYK